jgi:hypothetical protein
MKWLGFFLLLWSLLAGADERVSVCFNYGCVTQDEVVFSEAQLNELAGIMAGASSAAEERAAIGVAIGHMLGWAGQQTAISADRGGNFADNSVYGRMDCIDHSTTTTRLLRVLEKRDMLRFHRVRDPVLRQRYFVMVHYSAEVEEIGAVGDDGQTRRYVVDSWFFDNGRPAAVLPLAQWMAGDDPDVGEQ